MSEAFGPIMNCDAIFLLHARTKVCVLARLPAGLAGQSQPVPAETPPDGAVHACWDSRMVRDVGYSVAKLLIYMYWPEETRQHVK